jgi:hypothetical protein
VDVQEQTNRVAFHRVTICLALASFAALALCFSRSKGPHPVFVILIFIGLTVGSLAAETLHDTNAVSTLTAERRSISAFVSNSLVDRRVSDALKDEAQAWSSETHRNVDGAPLPPGPRINLGALHLQAKDWAAESHETVDGAPLPPGTRINAGALRHEAVRWENEESRDGTASSLAASSLRLQDVRAGTPSAAAGVGSALTAPAVAALRIHGPEGPRVPRIAVLRAAPLAPELMLALDPTPKVADPSWERAAEKQLTAEKVVDPGWEKVAEKQLTAEKVVDPGWEKVAEKQLTAEKVDASLWERAAQPKVMLAADPSPSTVRLTMTGVVADYIPVKLDTIRDDLAALERISASSVNVDANVSGAAAGGVVVLATLPADQAADIVLKFNAGTLSTLGFMQVHMWPGASLLARVSDCELAIPHVRARKPGF